MNMKEIRDIAKAQGIKPGKQTKVNLVRAIQLQEGNYACFATNCGEQCGQALCLWREDCLKLVQEQAA